MHVPGVTQDATPAAGAPCEHLLDLPDDVLGKVLLLCSPCCCATCRRFRSTWSINRTNLSVDWRRPVDTDLLRLLSQLPTLEQVLLKCCGDYHADGHHNMLISCPRLQSVKVTFADDAHLDVVSACPQLTSLEVEAVHFDHLETAVVCHSLALNIGPVAACTSLRQLCLKGSVPDLSPLSACLSLHTLTVDGGWGEAEVYEVCYPINLEELAACTSLTCLHLDGDMLSDLRPLAALTALQELIIGGRCDRFDLEPMSALSACAQLRTLHLTRCGMLDVSFLQACLELRDLELTRCHELSDVSALTACSQLTTVNVGGCSLLSNYMPLASCPRLRFLHVREGEVSTSLRAMLAAARPSLCVVEHEDFEYTDDDDDGYNDEDSGGYDGSAHGIDEYEGYYEHGYEGYDDLNSSDEEAILGRHW